MEQTYTIYRYRDTSWRGPTLTRPALVTMVAIITLGAWSLLHPAATPLFAGTNKPLPPLPARWHFSVLILNGRGIPGAAGRIADRVLADGYREAPATDAQLTTYARSIVLYRRGWQREAERLAKDAHVSAVAPLDGPLPAGHSRFPLVLILGR